MRNRLHKIGNVLTAIFVVDGVLWAAVLVEGGYSILSYGVIILIPLFFPAVAVALVVIGFYVYGFAKLSWKPRRAEWVFFGAFVLAVAGKLILVVARHAS